MLYGASSMGMTLHFHYCCGKLKGIDLVAVQHHCYKNKTERVSNKSCCDNKEVSIKIDDAQFASATYHPSFHPESVTFNDLHLATIQVYRKSNSFQLQQDKLLPDKERIHWLCIYRI